LQPDITLRLLDPEGLLAGGVALAAMAACALVIALRFRIAHLHLAAIGLFAGALPLLVAGVVDALVWFDVVAHDTYPPRSMVILAGLRSYALFLAACSISAATFRLLRSRVPAWNQPGR